MQTSTENARIVVRVGMSLVFLWFGINQLFLPGNFIGYLPPFIFDSAYANTAVMANGIFEIIFGSLLLTGFFTRIVALILALHLSAITVQLGYGETAVRDFGLTFATLSIAIGGADKLCLETYLMNRE